MPEATILKPNMVTTGKSSKEQASIDEVAEATLECLLRSVPAATAGIAFLSGGQSGELASAHLNAMHVKYRSLLPWQLTFSFARAIQQPAMQIWKGMEVNRTAAQESLLHRAKCSQAALRGEYDPSMEIEGLG